MRSASLGWKALAYVALAVAAIQAGGAEKPKLRSIAPDLAEARRKLVAVDLFGLARLQNDESRLRLLTGNRGIAGRYDAGASYRYVDEAGEAFVPPNDKGHAMLFDGAFGEHVIVAVRGKPRFRIEVDLECRYRVETIRYFGFCGGGQGQTRSVEFLASANRLDWQVVAKFPQAHPRGAYECFPLEARDLHQEFRWVRIEVTPVDVRRGSGVGEIEVWGYPYYHPSGWAISRPIELGGPGTLMACKWRQELGLPTSARNHPTSLSPLAESIARTVKQPSYLKVSGGKQLWEGDLPPNTIYSYRVSALNETGESAATPSQQATTGEKPGNMIILKWGHVPGATAYNVYRGPRAGAERLLCTKKMVYTPAEDFFWCGYVDHGDVEPNPRVRPPEKSTIAVLRAPSKVRTKVLKGVGHVAPGEYYYRVSAIDASGESEASPPCRERIRSRRECSLVSWSAVPGATGYKVYRSRNPDDFRNSLLACVGSACAYLDDGGRQPGNRALVSVRSGATPEACAAARWVPIESGRVAGLPVWAYLQCRVDLFSASEESSPGVGNLSLQFAPQPDRPRHISVEQSQALGQSTDLIVREAEDCALKYFINDERIKCANTLEKGSITYEVPASGSYRIGVVYKDDEDGVEEWSVGLNGAEIGRIRADEWPWMWPEAQKDSNYFLWLPQAVRKLSKGDRLVIRAIGPSVLCSRIDKIILVPPEIEPLEPKPEPAAK